MPPRRRRHRRRALVAAALAAALLTALLVPTLLESARRSVLERAEAVPAGAVVPRPAAPSRTPRKAEAAPDRDGARSAPRRRRQQNLARPEAAVRWRESRAVGAPSAGRLENGVRFPAAGRDFFTWDPIERRAPSRSWRRHATDDTVRTSLRVIRDFARANPEAPRVTVGDLSRPRGGDFGPRFGSIGHASHQNGLDVDIYYPRRDGRERPPRTPGQVDLRLAQDLVDRFRRAGAERIFVGPSLDLRGPRDVVQPLSNHDNHLHVRFRR